MYRFNDPITDAEHDFIIHKFSDLCEIVALGDYSPDARKELLECLLHYTTAHFLREEELMRGRGYPGLEAHTLSHAYMQEAFNRLRDAMPVDSANLRADLQLMRQMFLQHILTQDEAYGAWIAERHDPEGPEPPLRAGLSHFRSFRSRRQPRWTGSAPPRISSPGWGPAVGAHPEEVPRNDTGHPGKSRKARYRIGFRV